jgi:hypothetical protein
VLLNILFSPGEGYIHEVQKPEAMMEYAKVILPKVSFSKFLFRKELLKCIGWMKPTERVELKLWCLSNFRNEFPDVLEEAFAIQAA